MAYMIKVLVTHNETFHCDEVCAVALLKLLYGDIRVIRTRDFSQIQELASQGAYVIDVGQEYNHDQRRYDHHQKTFNDTWKGVSKEKPQINRQQGGKASILLSSFGLVYRHYGLDLIQQLTSDETPLVSHQINPESTLQSCMNAKTFENFYYHFVQHLDAHDNGVSQVPEGTVVNYTRVVTLPSIISSFNSHNVQNHELQYEQFMRAVDLASTIIHESLLGEIRKTVEFTQNTPIVDQALQEAREQKREWIVLPQSINWGPVLKTLDPLATIKLIILPRGNQGQYQVSTRRIPGQGFKAYLDLITPDEAKRLVGDENLIFLHRARFIGVTRNLESAQRIAVASLRVMNSWQTRVSRIWTRGSQWVKRNRTPLIGGAQLVLGSWLYWKFSRSRV